MHQHFSVPKKNDQFKTRHTHTHTQKDYLSNTTQLDWTFLASAATAPHKDPERIFTLIFICINNYQVRNTENYKAKENSCMGITKTIYVTTFSGS